VRKIIWILCLFISAVFADNGTILNETHNSLVKIQKEYQDSKNIWLSSLRSYRSYVRSFQELEILQKKLSAELANKNLEEVTRLKEEAGILQNNLNLHNYENRQPLYELFYPFESFLKQLNNAKISLFSLLSDELERNIKQLNLIMKNYRKEYKNALEIISALEDKSKKISQKESLSLQKELILTFENDKKLLQISLDTLEKTYKSVLEQYEFYNKEVGYFKSEELRKLLYVLFSVIVIFIFLNAVKIFLKLKRENDKSEEYEQRHFMIRKILNILFVIVTILIFAFTYIDNIAQVLAVFGVVGAGLTVVMKEWVLSYVGWFVLVTGNSIRIGDRIKISKDGRSVIGDVININLTKLTLYENITNDALTEHKKAGRVIFVPNYYLIMGEVYNYTHLSLKTILDLIEIRMTFDSNIAKAEKIALESAELITSRFTEMAKKQYDALKNRYTLRNMTQYPKVFFYPSAHGNGIVMGVWYVSPYREILKHKSEVMKEIVNKIGREKDIHLLYSGQSLFLQNNGKEVNHSDETKEIAKEAK
jgi:small-conductance mechanosensitive channel